MTDRLRTRLLHGGAWALTMRLAGALAFLGANALLARILAPNDLGVYYLAASLVTAIAAVGGFDEAMGPGSRWPAGEDPDLLDRVLATGAHGWYEPDAAAYHEHWRRVRQYVALQHRYGIGSGARLAKLARTDQVRLRVVAVEGSLIPDPRGTSPGRGAHLHPDAACLALAERRRAFPRALRLGGQLDAAELVAYLLDLGRNER